mmetsp:Transcript_9555/g.19861  ORF Transcript_9555/g.19861 Transcript_9555/m.19861 type:complete len:205 (+) Transcript_9555:796-1410(+)
MDLCLCLGSNHALGRGHDGHLCFLVVDRTRSLGSDEPYRCETQLLVVLVPLDDSCRLDYRRHRRQSQCGGRGVGCVGEWTICSGPREFAGLVGRGVPCRDHGYHHSSRFGMGLFRSLLSTSRGHRDGQYYRHVFGPADSSGPCGSRRNVRGDLGRDWLCPWSHDNATTRVESNPFHGLWDRNDFANQILYSSFDHPKCFKIVNN